ncbi:MAG: threonine/serine exporter family protein [Bacteroidales bacterium]|nr:threonine/serine exporter family protein [Bacteroidales bacterium]
MIVTDEAKAMDLACMAGQILLENGAELSRVEETMNRIADHYGVETRQFYLLTNGIFSTSGGRYAKVNPIPVKGSQFDKVRLKHGCSSAGGMISLIVSDYVL